MLKLEVGGCGFHILKMLSTTYPHNGWISPLLLDQEDAWGADLFCGPASQILLNQGLTVTLQKLGGHCLEGWRVSTNEWAADYNPQIETAPIYRQAHLSCMRFNLEPEHWQPPRVEEKWCVQPGDVVLNKLMPIRAVLVTSRTYRHPVDANCVIVRGLDLQAGAWVAVCLNQRPYEAYLTQHQGLTALPRASLRELRQLQFPPPPREMSDLSQQMWKLNDALLSNEEELIRTLGSVEAHVGADLQRLQHDAKVSQHMQTGYFLPAEAIEDSLLPSHVESAYLRYQLLNRLKWVPITRVGMVNLDGRDRCRQVDDVAYIRLGDVNQDLTVGHIEPAKVTQANRIFAEPLMVGEVLLSTFVASPRVAFIDEVPDGQTYVTDHLQRLRFNDTPGAWAMILNTSPIRQQLAGLGMGVVQQFAYADQVAKLLLPNVPLEVRREWEQVLYRHHHRQRELNGQWRSLWTEALELFRQVHLPGYVRPDKEQRFGEDT